MDFFNNKLVNYLQSELERKDQRIRELEDRLGELVDARIYSRLPKRLIETKENETQRENTDVTVRNPRFSDTFTAVMDDAVRRGEHKDDDPLSREVTNADPDSRED